MYCDARYQWILWNQLEQRVRSVADCARECRKIKGCTFFLYSPSYMWMKCAWVKTAGAWCPEGWKTISKLPYHDENNDYPMGDTYPEVYFYQLLEGELVISIFM